jgi:hypothetical protein
MKKSPVYLFYEIIANGADRTPGDDGDVHYCCFHGAHKICTIKKSMRSNLNGVFYFQAFASYFSHKKFFSSCKQPARPHQANVPVVLNPQRL